MIELRPWTAEDAESLYRILTTTDDLSTQIGGTSISTVAEAADFIHRVLAPRTAAVHNFAISEGGRAIGNAGLSSIEHVHDTGWVSYWVEAGARGRGVATSALASVANWGFEEVGLFRIELGHRMNNPASCAVAIRAGFRPEGIERAKLRYGQERFDVETHARLRSDPRPANRTISIRYA